MKAGGRRAEDAIYAAAQAATLAPPPGEDGMELTGAQSIEALGDALLDITGEPRVKFSNVRDIAVTKVGRWIVIKVRSRGPEPHELTFRINKGWAQILRGRLSIVLDK